MGLTFRHPLLQFCAFVVALALCGPGVPAWAADMVVARSDDVRYPVGTRIDGSQPLEVGASRTLILIARDGRKIRIEGPYNEVPAPVEAGGDDSMLSILARLLGRRRTGSRLAVYRSDSREGPDQVVVLDSDRVRCVSVEAPVRLRRLEPSLGSALKIQLPGER